MKDFVAHFKVSNGKIEWKNENYLNFNLPKYEGYSGVLKIKTKKNTRSLNQNALYWVWCGIIGETFGNTPEETHTILKGLVGHKKQVKIGKKTYTIPRSTTSYTVGEFVEYMFNVEVWAGQEGIALPSPEDYKNSL